MTRAAIIGAGFIGRSWANLFARAGWQVRLWDPLPSQRQQAVKLVERSRSIVSCAIPTRQRIA